SPARSLPTLNRGRSATGTKGGNSSSPARATRSFQVSGQILCRFSRMARLIKWRQRLAFLHLPRQQQRRQAPSFWRRATLSGVIGVLRPVAAIGILKPALRFHQAHLARPFFGSEAAGIGER